MFCFCGRYLLASILQKQIDKVDIVVIFSNDLDINGNDFNEGLKIELMPQLDLKMK